MAFSMHPFDVDSWMKNGSDIHLESVLELFAELTEQDPKNLAEEVRSMSGPVRKHMRDHPGTGLLEAWEAQADGRFKGRSKATSEALYTVRAIHRGTGSLESRFHKGRQLNGKKHMGEESMEDRMRIYVGPPLAKFCTRKVVKGKPEYAGSYLCKRSQAQYRMKYGAKRLKNRPRSKGVEDEASIPPRSDKGKPRTLRPGRMAEFLKKKAVQAKEKKKAISHVDGLVMKKLKEITEGPSVEQVKASEKEKLNLEKKRKFIDAMLRPHSESKFLKEKNEHALAKQEKVAKRMKFHVASLHHNALKERCLVAEDCKMFGAETFCQCKGVVTEGGKSVSCKACKSAEDRAEHACQKVMSVQRRSMQKFLMRNPDKKKLWFSQHTRLLKGGDWKQELVDKKVLSEDVAILGAVVFGGYLVDENWLKKSREAGMLEKELLVEPVWNLVGSMKKALELMLDESLLQGELGKECKLLMETKPDRVLVQEVRDVDDPAKVLQEASSSCWIWRMERSEIRRKESWVVCSDEARVEKLTERKEKMEEELTKLEERITKMEQECESAVGAALLGKRRQLKEKQEKLKEKRRAMAKMKGVPITLPKFLEEVVLPQCHLVR
jgi:hypothetical protein